VILDNSARNGDGGWSRSASRNGNGQGPELARLVARQADRAPGTPGSWSRFLVKHARWILAVTLAVVAVATAYAVTRTPMYKSEADVVVEPSAAPAASGGQQLDMNTEASIATSGVVLGIASQATGVPVAALGSGLSVKARGASYVLQIIYSNSNPYVAQHRAQAIAQAYTSFRSPHPSSKRATPSAAPIATLITPAMLPASSYSPKYVLDIGVALIAGLALAVATAWGRDYLDDRLRGPLDLERQADADVLALIPAFRPRRREPGYRLALAVSPRSIVAEAYRGLRTRVLLVAAARNSRTLLVTSPSWEDRGTVAANLAAALAQAGHSTVLVCADARWGSAHLIVGTWDDGHGLTGLLERQTDLASALQPTRVPCLQLLPPGAVPADPAALLQRPALRAVLNEIRNQADVTVIEAPPLLVSPDARSLADTAEMTLLIADARASTRAQVRAAARDLRQGRTRLAGCVLVNAGRRRRLRRERLNTTYDHAENNRSRHAMASDGNQTPDPGAAQAEQGTDITEEFQGGDGS
jgi:capsular exopolysaccharide synthesis family protein